MNSYTHVYELIISGINKITVVTRHKAQGTRHKAQGTRHKAQGRAPKSDEKFMVKR